jgi:hypothetical protein
MDPREAELIERLRQRRPFEEPREMRWAMIAFRGVFLLVAAGLLAFVPVTVFRCGPAADGTAACDIEERRWLGRELVEVNTVSGVASAVAAPDRWTIRFVGREDQNLLERSQSAVVGTSMVALAGRVSATASGPATAARWKAWQFPLPVAGFAGAALIFVLSGPAGWLLARRRARREAQERGERARADVVDAAIPVGMLALAAGVFWLAPVVVYRCSRADAGASCRIEWRAAGIVTLEAVDVVGVARAASDSRTIRHREQRDGKWHESTETVTTVTFSGADGRVLFTDEQSTVVGTSGEALAAGVTAVGTGQQPAFTGWRAPWLGLLFAGLLTLFGVLAFLTFLRKLQRS